MTLIIRKPNRLSYFDYSNCACYFVTICTFERKELFGYVDSEKVVLNFCGKIVKNTIQNIPQKYKDMSLEEFIIMPNHIHAILTNNSDRNEGNRANMIISKIINQFKGECTKNIRHHLNKDINVWQRSFYDRIIRNDTELSKIREYIINNPLKWDLEKNNPENLLI